MTDATHTTCDVVDCDDVATGRYLHSGHEGAVEFGVCSGHFARIAGGAGPVIVGDQVDQPENDERAALLLGHGHPRGSHESGAQQAAPGRGPISGVSRPLNVP